MVQVRGVTSEALEARIRELLPSQNGFTEELSAQNLIVPVIDMTSAASGAITPEFLQTAWDFATEASTIANTTTDLITNPGFWQIDLNWSAFVGTPRTASLQLDDNAGTTKVVWEITSPNLSTSNVYSSAEGKFVVFVQGGYKLTATTNSATSILNVWYRQVADSVGTLVNPLGFTPQ